MLSDRSLDARAALLTLMLRAPLRGAGNRLSFDELYDGDTGLSRKTKEMLDHKVVIDGFIAFPLEKTSKSFILTNSPAALCPLYSSDADWMFDIVVVYPAEPQMIVRRRGEALRVEGVLKRGSRTNGEIGFVYPLRLIDATVKPLQEITPADSRL